MSFFRVTEPNSVAVPIDDLGIVIAADAANVVLSNQFSVHDLYLSADLEAAIINGDLDVEINYGTGFAAVAAVDYTNRDALAAFLNVFEITNENSNERLVNNTDASSGSQLHHHDTRYFTKTELQSTANGSSGGTLIGLNDDAWDTEYPFTFTTLQGFVDGLYTILTTGFDLDQVYDNDADGILNVDGTTKPLDFRSDNVNDIIISRFSTPDLQQALIFDVSADELILGSLAVGGLNDINVRVRSDLIVDGDIVFTGTITDTTVNELNVTNANIRLRDGATAVPGADAYIEVERGTSGNDARLLWNETSDRWQAGIVGTLGTIALLEFDEIVTGVWEFQGGAATEPSMYLTDKASAPTTNLGTATQIPISMINNTPAYYDKSNSRNKFLSMYRMHQAFSGRDNANNSNEYLRAGEFTSNQSSYRLIKNMTLIGISAQTNGAETWTARVRKNGVVTNLASLALSAVAGAQDATLNVDFNAGDKIEVYCDGTGVDRPFVMLEFAERF
jgi:hypothetical protein